MQKANQCYFYGLTPWYQDNTINNQGDNMKPKAKLTKAEKARAIELHKDLVQKPKVAIDRVQLGVRMEVRLVKVLKALAEYADISLGELLEDIILHSFEGPNASAFAKDDFRIIADLKKVYGMNYDVHSNYRFVEKNANQANS